VQVKNKLALTTIYLDDDAFLMYPTETIREFCDEYKQKIGLPFIITGATPSTISREKLYPLTNAGLRYLRMGIQSGSERIKKLYHRIHSNQQVIDAAKIINEFRKIIPTPVYDIILDNPWETDADTIDTLMLLSKMPAPYQLSLYALTLYPKTELYEKAKDEGLIANDHDDVYEKDYNGIKKTYLNSLFVLVNACEGKISPLSMSLLTNGAMRQIGFNWIIYWLLLATHKFSRAWGYIRTGNFDRIIKHFQK
jgi:coproporphyrinogen III oxidase-like Fe-S oxidoreductase